jgi:hypothetical protein
VFARTGKDFTLMFHYIPFRIVCSYMLIQRKITNLTNHTREENVVYGRNADVAAIIGICNVPLSLCFVFGGLFTQPSSVSGEAATEKSIFVQYG